MITMSLFNGNGPRLETIKKFTKLISLVKSRYPNGFTANEYADACKEIKLNTTVKGFLHHGNGIVIKLQNSKFMFPALKDDYLGAKLAEANNKYHRDLRARRKILDVVLKGDSAEKKLAEMAEKNIVFPDNEPIQENQEPLGNTILNSFLESEKHKEPESEDTKPHKEQSTPNSIEAIKPLKTSKKISILWGLFSLTTESK